MTIRKQRAGQLIHLTMIAVRRSLAQLISGAVLLFTTGGVSAQEFTITDSAIAVEVSNTYDGSGSVYGIKTDVSGTGTGVRYGNAVHVSGPGTGNHYGSHVTVSSPAGSHHGSYHLLNGGGSGWRYGVLNTLAGTSLGAQFGVYTTISVTNNAEHYGSYTWLLGNGTGARYGSYCLLDGTGTGFQYGSYHLISNANNSTHIGTLNALEGTGSGTRIGCSNDITDGTGTLYGTYSAIHETAGNGMHYGAYTDLSGSGSGAHFGSFNSLSGSGDGTRYGSYNVISGSGAGIHYGTYNTIVSAGSANHIAGYFSAAGAENFAAVFDAGHVIANNTGMNYDFTIKGETKDFQLFVDADAGTVGVGTDTPSDALHIVGTGTDDLLRVQIGTATKMRIFNNGSISLGSNNAGIDPGDVYIANELGIQRSNPSFPLHVGTNGTNGNGAHVTVGGTWTNGSSRQFKENFRDVDAGEILAKLSAMDILRWNYKESKEGDHIGPIAEDFYAAFGLGHDAQYISTVDADGVALAAIQALNEKLIAAHGEIVRLENALNNQTDRLDVMERSIRKRR